MFVFNIFILVHMYMHGMTILQDALELCKFGNWKIWGDVIAGKASREQPILLFPTWVKKKVLFFVFERQTIKIVKNMVEIMKQILNWSGLRGKNVKFKEWIFAKVCWNFWEKNFTSTKKDYMQPP